MTIRDAHVSDAPEIAQLTNQLGYVADSVVIAGRLARLGRQRDQVVFVAVLEGKVVGWIQAHASDALESGYRAEIVGLVISEAFRRRGIGRALVQHAEQWASGIGAEAFVVRSNAKRVESHSFYPAVGYSFSKTQAVYRKYLKQEVKCVPETQ
jgi:GNAT superfamily N-acetyltransferase